MKTFEKLSKALNIKANDAASIDAGIDLKSKAVLDEHLGRIAAAIAAHSSVHGDHHGSIPD